MVQLVLLGLWVVTALSSWPRVVDLWAESGGSRGNLGRWLSVGLVLGIIVMGVVVVDLCVRVTRGEVTL